MLKTIQELEQVLPSSFIMDHCFIKSYRHKAEIWLPWRRREAEVMEGPCHNLKTHNVYTVKAKCWHGWWCITVSFNGFNVMCFFKCWLCYKYSLYSSQCVEHINSKYLRNPQIFLIKQAEEPRQEPCSDLLNHQTSTWLPLWILAFARMAEQTSSPRRDLLFTHIQNSPECWWQTPI